MRWAVEPGSDESGQSATRNPSFGAELKSVPPISHDAVRAELERVLSSQAFSGSERLSQFLRFVVEQSISGQADALKEWLLGVRVFGRNDSFDPRIDAIVRVEAGRLRAKLAHYYLTEGHNDPVLIEVHKGTYAPVFQARSPIAPVAPAPVQGTEPTTHHERKDGLTSIVVLPFINLSADPNNEYFSDGLTEEVIAGLTRIPGLRVIARSTAFRYKGQAQDIRGVGLELNVSAALEGSVRRIGDRLRISAHLIDTRDCFHLWSHTYEREMKDIFAIQQEIAEAISGMVRGQLSSPAPTREIHDTSAEAYDLYLRAMYFEGKRTMEGFSKGLEQLHLAANLDSQCAPVFARLANHYTLRAVYGLEAPAIAMNRAGDAANRALNIDATLADAHAAQGFVTSLYGWDWSAAGEHYRRALELNPGVPEIHHRYAVFYLSPLGRTEEALGHIQQAKHLDPMSLVLQASECAVLVWGRQYEAATAKGKKTVELEPTYFLGHLYLSWAYLMQGMAAEAIRSAEEAVRLSEETPPALTALGNAYALAGQMDKARALIERMEQRAYPPPVYISSICASVGEIDQAFQWLAQAQDERSPALFSLRIGLWNQAFRSDPRFNKMVSRVGLDGACAA
jgi:TolB-like protein/Flp pilus assembly protein TadD